MTITHTGWTITGAGALLTSGATGYALCADGPSPRIVAFLTVAATLCIIGSVVLAAAWLGEQIRKAALDAYAQAIIRDATNSKPGGGVVPFDRGRASGR